MRGSDLRRSRARNFLIVVAGLSGRRPLVQLRFSDVFAWRIVSTRDSMHTTIQFASPLSHTYDPELSRAESTKKAGRSGVRSESQIALAGRSGSRPPSEIGLDPEIHEHSGSNQARREKARKAVG